MPTILVVEDEMLIRLHVADYFRDCGFDVLEAVDGARAIEILEGAAPVDVVFTDVTLPGEPDGFGLAEWIRQRKPELPVFLTSGEVTASYVLAARRDEPFFAKPCDYDEVATHIRASLEKSA
jgi:CheY-like chemotaxis protein